MIQAPNSNQDNSVDVVNGFLVKRGGVPDANNTAGNDKSGTRMPAARLLMFVSPPGWAFTLRPTQTCKLTA